MKKVLTLLGSFFFITNSSTLAVACNNTKSKSE
ncbi:lipoprotein [Mycoplasma capricolum]